MCVNRLSGVVDIDACCHMVTKLLTLEVVRAGHVDLRVGSTGQPPPDTDVIAAWAQGQTHQHQQARGTFLVSPMTLADVAARTRDEYRCACDFLHLGDTLPSPLTSNHLYQCEAAVSPLGVG